MPCPAPVLCVAGLLGAAGDALACVAPGEVLRDGLNQEDQLLRGGLDELLDELLREGLDELLRELLDELLRELLLELLLLRLPELPVSTLALRSKVWCASPWPVSSCCSSTLRDCWTWLY